MSPLHRPKPGQPQPGSGKDVLYSSALPVTLVECPRDAMQGWPHIIPTERKVAYLNALLKVGFGTLDFGSFVSAKAIPQMADTAEVLSGLEWEASATKLLAIVANYRGADEASSFDAVKCLGFPFSVSETFQLRNTNKTIEGSFGAVEEILDLCEKRQKELVVYLSMGFGNPYGEPWNEEIVFQWASALARLGVKTLSVADTVGLAEPQQVFSIVDFLVWQLPACTIGVHLHSTHHNRADKIDAALDAGCRRFDGALKGIGGCPMAGNALVGNMDTEWMVGHFSKKHLLPALDAAALADALMLAGEIFV
jgi:hydroxymethylglutaryl-CoA lyase